MLSVFAHLLGVTLLAALLSSLYWETDETAELPPALVVIVLPDEEPPPTIIELRFDPLTAPNGTPLEVAALDTPAMSPNTPQVKAPLAGSPTMVWSDAVWKGENRTRRQGLSPNAAALPLAKKPFSAD